MAESTNDNRNSGYINLRWDNQAKVWQIGGSYTTEDGIEWDLGYCKVGPESRADAINTIARQMGPTLAGKGVRRVRKNNNGGY